MELLPLRTSPHTSEQWGVPYVVYTVGTEHQLPIARVEGFSAHHLILTVSGKGRFRAMGGGEWRLVEPASLLFIPAGFGHEYMPDGDKPWHVAFVTFSSAAAAGSDATAADASWGFGSAPAIRAVRQTERLLRLIAGIWERMEGPGAGGAGGVWETAELLYAFLVEARKQMWAAERGSESGMSGRTTTGPDAVVLSAAIFLQDHIERSLTVTDLAERFGYSSKQLTRLFRQEFRTTPLQYLKRIRLQTAASLLEAGSGLSLSQIAARIGMEPVYFSRAFRAQYGCAPSEFRERLRR